jgi:hypothetical protein
MTKCHGCKKTIWFRRFQTHEQDGFTIRADGSQDIHHKSFVICFGCHLKEKAAKFVKKQARRLWEKAAKVAMNLARRAGLTSFAPILGAFGLFVIAGLVGWFFVENTISPSQNTVAVTALAPKATAPKPILIPPENRDAWRR